MIGMPYGRKSEVRNAEFINLDMNKKVEVSKVISRVSKRYKFERLVFEKKVSLVSFFKEAYIDQFNAPEFGNEDVIAKKWNWINVLNPNLPDSQLPSWICTSNGKIVGHFGIIPVSLKFGKKYYMSCWGRELIILPQFRKLGIGPLLVTRVIEDIKQDMLIFMVGGLNDHVYAIYKKFGFIDSGFIPLYIRISNLRNVLHLILSHRILINLLSRAGEFLLRLFYLICSGRKSKKIQIREISKFDERFDTFWNEVSAQFPIIIKRDQRSLNWRFVEQPYWKYKIFKAEVDGILKGYIVLRRGLSKGLKAGIISDLFAHPNDTRTISALIHFAIKYFESGPPVDILRCNIKHRKFENVLKRNGFIQMRSNTRFLFAVCQDNIDLSLLKDRKNWFITYADSDLDLS